MLLLQVWLVVVRYRLLTQLVRPQPVGVFVETFGTETIPVAKIQEAVLSTFDLRPAAIIRDLDLLRPIYSLTSAYGHFGRELPEFAWERTDRVAALQNAVK
jgi:S-adenosylmethionine synthetase